MTSKSPLLIHGMHGLGDNIHQRAIIRALLKRDNSIALETSWPCVYQDLAGPDLRFIRKPVALRTQLKNAAREAHKFVPGVPPHHAVHSVRITYTRSGTVPILQTMFAAVGIPDDYAEADYRLPIPAEWTLNADMLRESWKTTKPVMIYRPLIVRPEYRLGDLRNADADNYAELVAMVRDSFFVVSLADLEPNREWIVGPQLIADATYHNGELPFETMAAVVAKATLLYTSSGFPAVLGPAVGVPTISIESGYEPLTWHADGAKFVPYLGLTTKTTGIPSARAAVAEFVGKLGISTAAETRPMSEIFIPAAHLPEPVRGAPQPRVMPRVRVGHPSLLYQRRPPVKA